MSLMPQSPRGNGPPHIRLNSGTQEARTDDNSPPAVRPSTARTNSARSLTQPIRPTTAPQSPGIYSPPVPGVYGNADVAASAELLLPPRKLKTRPYRDESPVRSPSAMSRRTSWSSDMTHDSRGPFASPFDDSRAPSRAGSEEDLNTQTVSEKFNILPSAGLLLFPEDVEKDDYLHNPDPNEKEARDCDIFTKRGFANVGALAIFALGLLVLFIGYPVLYVTTLLTASPPLYCILTICSTFVDKMTKPEITPCTNNPLCIKGKEHEPLLQNLRIGLIDPDTPESAKFRTGANGKRQKLVFSDEFNTDGRTFYDGDDPYFQAVDIWYGATQDLEVSFRKSRMVMASLTPNSGTIPMRLTPRAALSTSTLIFSRTTDSSTGLAWSSRGTSCAIKVAISRPVSRFLERAMSVVTGPVSGPWAISPALATLDPLKVCGLTATTTSAMWASPPTRARTTVSATCLVCDYLPARARARITPAPASREVRLKSMLWKDPFTFWDLARPTLLVLYRNLSKPRPSISGTNPTMVSMLCPNKRFC